MDAPLAILSGASVTDVGDSTVLHCGHYNMSCSCALMALSCSTEIVLPKINLTPHTRIMGERGSDATLDWSRDNVFIPGVTLQVCFLLQSE